jgi:hypothetical protein
MRILTILAAMLATAAQAPGPQDGAALTPGTITVELAAGQGDPPAAAQLFVDAVSDALTDAHFLILPGVGHGRYIARVAVTRQARGSVASEAGGGSGGLTMSGARLGVELPSSKTQLAGLVVTRLDVRIVRRDIDQTVWSGSASTAQVEGTPAGALPVVAGKLADALIRRFPEKFDGPIAIP